MKLFQSVKIYLKQVLLSFASNSYFASHISKQSVESMKSVDSSEYLEDFQCWIHQWLTFVNLQDTEVQRLSQTSFDLDFNGQQNFAMLALRSPLVCNPDKFCRDVSKMCLINVMTYELTAFSWKRVYIANKSWLKHICILLLPGKCLR